MTAVGTTAGPGGAGGGFLLAPERVKEASLAGLIVLSLVVFNLVIDDYVSGRFFNRVAISVAITALLAAGEAVVIIARQVDLSVGSIVGVSAYVTGDVLTSNPDLSPVLAVALAVAIGAGLGLVNGTLVAFAGVPAIIVTLGTLAIYRAALTNVAGGTTLTTNALPDWVVDLPRSTIVSAGDFDLRTMFVIALVAGVVLHLAMGSLRWGRRIYAIGSNPDAATQAGLPRRRLVLGAFVLCGALAGLAGFMFLGQFGTVNVTAGANLELAAIGAAVVGGVSIQGGSGTVLGAFLGAVLIEILDLSLVRVPQISEFWRDAILGLLILGAVILDVVVNGRLRGRRRRDGVAAPTGGAAT
ncbi:MAG: ABC transporter permease [Actinomycetota bacterium]|nr:ABC transporter permease [Actinomycetota bacterium]